MLKGDKQVLQIKKENTSSLHIPVSGSIHSFPSRPKLTIHEGVFSDQSDSHLKPSFNSTCY